MMDCHPPPAPVNTASAAVEQAPALVLDARALAALAQLDPTGAHQLVRRVLTTYRSSLARLLAQLVAARRPFDAATLRLVAHTLKSSSASVGALYLSVLCGQAEQALRDGRLNDLPPLLDDLEVQAVRADAAARQLLMST